MERGGDAVYWILKKFDFDGRKIRKVLNRNTELARALREILELVDENELKMLDFFYKQLQRYGFDEDVSWMVANFISNFLF